MNEQPGSLNLLFLIPAFLVFTAWTILYVLTALQITNSGELSYKQKKSWLIVMFLFPVLGSLYYLFTHRGK